MSSKQLGKFPFQAAGAPRVPSWIPKAQNHGTPRVVTLRPPSPAPEPSAFGSSSASGESRALREEQPPSQRPGSSLTFRLQEGCAEVDRLKSVLLSAIEQFDTARQRILEQSEAQLIELALALAERLAAEQLEVHPGHVRNLVVEGLEALSSNDESVVRLGSDFASVVAEVSAHARDCGLSCRVLCD